MFSTRVAILATNHLCNLAAKSSLRSPVDFAGTPWAPRAMSPEHGEHSEEVLRELGRDAGQIEALRKTGVLG